eukprot:CAMPEP_0202694424 /NCGR_PEP_ID=MMETSP1385-20130828/8290_1 /ASSEMBLY_ACC=CAM_ASM_000861 /TAXON_ID=933848 /ORGANISM="Elphidium margaritaceum" /LENGTH=101 /DNA_ID=CAMNT_0049350269 /DNA_START=22 /DNA_END=328 /DNA_ORIENTATION=-
MASNAIQAASGELVLSYYENAYPDEGDFTLCYNLSDVRQRFQNALPAEFWVTLREILDGVIQNKEIKKEWNDVRVNATVGVTGVLVDAAEVLAMLVVAMAV